MPKSLVLVVGAGASKEADIPAGAELKQSIASALDIRYENGYRRVSGDHLIDSAFRTLAKDINPLLHSARRIATAMPQAMSIDNFIDSHRADGSIALCGKLAIARCILEAERSSSLYVNPSNFYNTIDFERAGATWFNSFFQLLTENCGPDDLRERLSTVAIVCFNYDRCIEHYLFSSLKNYYSLPDAEAADILKSLEIYHPYGVVGGLPWQTPGTGMAFGGSPDHNTIVRLAKGLRTFTEGIDPGQSNVTTIRSLLSTARRVAFLGFAFHRLNIELLFPLSDTKTEVRDTPVYATGIGISKADAELIVSQLSDRMSIRRECVCIRTDVKCAQLFYEYWRSLSLL